uniref:Venom allergen 5 n=1 Tax=Rhynchium brunneum TaxID=522437 RepID=VA5_RHYBR|nr:RecName: Full=Venom allergen 5; AltName: Full=Antigen 5; AltName: Full=Cysteine-rich venom protein; Short=CRVP; Flags: Precursor [Rhynchium brunneum]ACC93935.1 venom antigen 5 [Rhynchium brunneum]
MTKIDLLARVFVIATIIALATAVDYYKLKCPPKTKHTMCIYGTNSHPSRNCGVVKGSGPTDQEKREILKEHNDYGHKVASGEEKRGVNGGQPAAKNMEDMTWDDELAKVAQTWANQCTINHDKCRSVSRFSVGQNLASKSTTGNDFPPVVELIQLWENEVSDFDKNNIKSLPASGISKTGHYTQMVWAKSNKLGCGSIKHHKDGWNKHFLVCNYGPSGNYLGQSVYEV